MPDTSVLSTPAAPAPAAAAPGAAPAAPAPGAAPAAASNAAWFGDTHKGFLEGKGFASSPNADPLIESYINLEKLVGVPADQILRLPKPGDAEAEGKFYNTLGRPDSPDKYTAIEPLKDDPLDKAMAPLAFKLGLSDRQWTELRKGLLEATVKLNADGATATAEEVKAHHAKRMEALQADIGPDKFPEFAEDARRAVRTAVPDSYKDPATGKQWTGEQINQAIQDALGADLALRIFSKLGSFQAEDRRVDGGAAPSGVMTAEAAQERWSTLRQDAGWMDRYMKGGHEERREFERLSAIIAGHAT